MTDLTYTDDGMFTRFIPQTPAGEAVWREMALQDPHGVVAFVNIHAPAILRQVRKAGYTATKAPKVKDTREALDALCRELTA